jgi:hypothetical protein
MFKFLWKLIKWFVIIIVAMFVAFAAYDFILDPNEEAREECYTTHGELYCDWDGNVGDKEAIDKAIADKAADKAKKEFEERTKKNAAIAEKRIADARQAEASRIDDKLTAGRLMCKFEVRKLAKYPTKVDYEGWTEGNIVENFTKDSQHPDRFWINLEGEWMNGIGNMIPFTAHCKLDMNSTTGKIIDIWIR